MSSRAPSSQTYVAEVQDFSDVTVSKAIQAKFATLSLLDYDGTKRIRLLTKGEFFINFVEHKIIPIIMSICQVEGLQWPIAKDSPVVRVGRRSFVFTIPGLLYGLQFPPDCKDSMLSELVSYLEMHAYFEDHREKATGIRFPLPESEDSYWAAARSQIEEITHVRLSRFGHHPVNPVKSYPPPASCFLKLHRLSIATHAVTQSMIEGALLPVHTKVYNLKHNPDGTVMVKAGPTVSVFTDIVEAVELKKRYPAEYAEFLREYQTGMFSAGDMHFEVWTLIKNSLREFTRIVLQVEEDIFAELRTKETGGGEGSSSGNNQGGEESSSEQNQDDRGKAIQKDS